MSKRIRFFLSLILTLSWLMPCLAESTLDSERIELEGKMQQRVEEALARIVPSGQVVVVVRVEPVVPEAEKPVEKKEPSEQYYLPGVPSRRLVGDTGDSAKAMAASAKPAGQSVFQRFINKITVTLVLDKDLPDDLVERVRALTRQILSLDDARGDTLDVQKTAFNKPVQDDDPSTSLVSRLQKQLKGSWLVVALLLAVFSLIVFFLFIFGPVRIFLDKFVQVLPTLKPIAPPRGARQVFDAPPFPFMPPGYALPGGMPGANASSFSGSLQVENPNKQIAPFGFIREDHISNLSVLLSRESPEKAAVVLGYLPPEWISRVLERLDPHLQMEVATHLATTRQMLPEQVEDIEQDLKRRLDYLIGGPERIFAVYESLEPEAQRRMYESLRESRPELAEELRSRTMLFEDLDRLDSPGLKLLLREVEIQTLVMALRGASALFRDRVLEHVSQGKAQIVREELELSEGSGGRATVDAQRKMVQIAKRLEREGQITIPQGASAPTARYAGGSAGGADLGLAPDAEPTDGNLNSMRERFRQMMGNAESTGTDD